MYRLFSQVSGILLRVDLPDGHYVRLTGATLLQHVEDLGRASGPSTSVHEG